MPPEIISEIPVAETDPAPAFDRAELFRRTFAAFERLEKLYDRTRKKLERAKKAEDYLAFVISHKRLLIQKLLSVMFSPEDIAQMLIDDLGGIPVARKKLMAAIRKCAPQPETNDTSSSGASQKRRGRPPKNAAAAPDDGAGEIEKSAASVTQTVIASARNAATFGANSREMSTSAAVTEPKNTAKSSAKSTAVSTTVDSAAAQDGPQDDEKRIAMMRRKKPDWTLDYRDDPRYGPLVARHDGENDADYHWRMWHTPPAWAEEFPRFESETHTEWIQKCWLQASPEERAAHEASLPTTAR